MRLVVGACLLAMAALGSGAMFAANGPTFKSVYKFTGGSDGFDPGPVTVHNGVLYGTASGGANSGKGTVYSLTAGKSGKWSFSTLYTFQGGSDGWGPGGQLAFDKKGNIYGVTLQGGGGNDCGGANGCGTVWELSPPAKSGGSWTETLLYIFQGPDGAYPDGGLSIDADGNLFGTTSQCCANPPTCPACGTVFELSPPASSGDPWTFANLYTFQGTTDGSSPSTALALGEGDVIYGSAGPGSSALNGTVYSLTPPAQSGEAWTFSVIDSFSGANEGMFPGSLALHDGDVYGATYYGSGSLSEASTVFDLAKVQGTWSENLFYTFPSTGADGTGPEGAPAFDSSGNIYGATSNGGTKDGTVFELSPSGDSYVETVLHDFVGSDGNFPNGVVLSGSSLYGTTQAGGTKCSQVGYGCGTVFEVVP
jgi:hypothetical protein